MIGQDEAVDAVVDRVAMLKAGLTDSGQAGRACSSSPGRPAPARPSSPRRSPNFSSASADRLIRLDMSEFQSARVDAEDRRRPRPSDESNALTDRVRKQPFSVVLLDEFEKAHANAWDLFLQVFDDGRLTDAQGHTVDFRHCIIILTSNLGSTIRHRRRTRVRRRTRTRSRSTDHARRFIRASVPSSSIASTASSCSGRSAASTCASIVTKELSRVLERRGLRHREWAVEWEVVGARVPARQGLLARRWARGR